MNIFDNLESFGFKWLSGRYHPFNIAGVMESIIRCQEKYNILFIGITFKRKLQNTIGCTDNVSFELLLHIASLIPLLA